eukprot:295256_1
MKSISDVQQETIPPQLTHRKILQIMAIYKHMLSNRFSISISPVTMIHFISISLTSTRVYHDITTICSHCCMNKNTCFQCCCNVVRDNKANYEHGLCVKGTNGRRIAPHIKPGKLDNTYKKCPNKSIHFQDNWNAGRTIYSCGYALNTKSIDECYKQLQTEYVNNEQKFPVDIDVQEFSRAFAGLDSKQKKELNAAYVGNSGSDLKYWQFKWKITSKTLELDVKIIKSRNNRKSKRKTKTNTKNAQTKSDQTQTKRKRNGNTNQTTNTPKKNHPPKKSKLAETVQTDWSKYEYLDIMVLEYIYNNFRFTTVEINMLKCLIMSIVIDDAKQIEVILSKLQKDSLIEQSDAFIKCTKFGINQYTSLLEYEKNSNQAHSKMKKVRDEYNDTHRNDPITPTDTDGNCLFNSVIEQIEPSTIDCGGPMLLRETCIELMTDNVDAFKNMYAVHNANMRTENITPFDIWLKNHRKNGEFDQNGVIFIIVLMALLNAPVQIRNANDNIIFPNNWSSEFIRQLHQNLIDAHLFDVNMKPILLYNDATIKLVNYFDHYEPIVNSHFNSNKLSYNLEHHGAITKLLERIYNGNVSFTNLTKHARRLKERLEKCSNETHIDFMQDEDIDINIDNTNEKMKISLMDPKEMKNDNITEDDKVLNKRKTIPKPNAKQNAKEQKKNQRRVPRTNPYSVNQYKIALQRIMFKRFIDIEEANEIAIKCGVPFHRVSDILSNVKKKMKEEGTFLSQQITDDTYLHTLTSNDSVPLILRHTLNSDFIYEHSNLFNHRDEKMFIRNIVSAFKCMTTKPDPATQNSKLEK